MVLTRFSRALSATVLAAVAVVASTTIATSPPASAASEPVVSSSLSWAVSENVFTASSLAPSAAAVAPATKDLAGWNFPQGTGTYDVATGETHLSFGGALEAGNSAQGNYGFRFSDLQIDVDSAGRGTLTGDISTRGPGSAEFNTPAVQDVVIVTFSASDPTVSGGTTTFTVTPDTEAVASPAFPDAQQFPQSLIDAMPPLFAGHFRQTSPDGPDAAANLKKLPAPLTFSVTTSATPPSSTTTTLAPTTTTSAPTTTTLAPTPNEPVEATAGSLDWGIKASFVGYIAGQPDGSIDLIGNATRNADNTLRFPLASGSSYTSVSSLSAPFSGGVQMVAHGGELDLTISDPRVAINGTSGTLTVDAQSKSLDTGDMEIYDDVVLADLDLSGVQATADGDQITFANVPASLTEAGAPAFAGFYSAGEALDPVTFELTVESDETLPDATTPMVTCVEGTVVAGTPVRLCGKGFLPGEQVQAFIHSDPTLLGITTANAAGDVDDSFVVPADTPPGIHRFELRGLSSGVSIMSGEITVSAGAGVVGAPSAAELPRTGSTSATSVAAGLALLAAGAAVTAASRRRRMDTTA